MEATLKLEVVVRIQKIMLPVVLILVNNFHGAQTLFKQLQFFCAASVTSVSMSAPFQKDFGQVLTVFPVSGIDQRKQPGSITARTRTEDPQFGQLFGSLRR